MVRDGSLTVIVCGALTGELRRAGSEFATDALSYFDIRIAKIQHVVAGSTLGLEGLALRWARRVRVPNTHWPAHWTAYGPAARPVRNTEQLAFLLRITDGLSRACLAFPGGPGTEDLIARAQRARVPVWRCHVAGSGWRWISG